MTKTVSLQFDMSEEQYNCMELAAKLSGLETIQEFIANASLYMAMDIALKRGEQSAVDAVIASLAEEA